LSRNRCYSCLCTHHTSSSTLVYILSFCRSSSLVCFIFYYRSDTSRRYAERCIQRELAEIKQENAKLIKELEAKTSEATEDAIQFEVLEADLRVYNEDLHYEIDALQQELENKEREIAALQRDARAQQLHGKARKWSNLD